MLTYYMSKYLLKAVGGRNAATIVVDGVEEKHIREAAEVTTGFSGEEEAFYVTLCTYYIFLKTNMNCEIEDFVEINRFASCV